MFTRVGAREDSGGRLVLQCDEGVACVLPASEPVGPRLDERADERAVLVERRPVGPRVLGERDRKVSPALELRAQLEEGAKAERAQGTEEGWRARVLRRHEGTGYAAWVPFLLDAACESAPMRPCASSSSSPFSPPRSPRSSRPACRPEP